MLPAPELTNDPVIVQEEQVGLLLLLLLLPLPQGAAGSQAKSDMVSLADFDLIKVIGRGSYAKVRVWGLDLDIFLD